MSLDWRRNHQLSFGNGMPNSPCTLAVDSLMSLILSGISIFGNANCSANHRLTDYFLGVAFIRQAGPGKNAWLWKTATTLIAPYGMCKPHCSNLPCYVPTVTDPITKMEVAYYTVGHSRNVSTTPLRQWGFRQCSWNKMKSADFR